MQSPVRRSTRAPLRRTPKRLDEEPRLYEPVGGGGAGAASLRASHSRGRGRVSGSGATTAAEGDDEGELMTLSADESVDESIRAQARRIARRLSVPRPRTGATDQRGSGELAPRPYRDGADEIDLDRSLQVLAQRPIPEDSDIVVRERVRTRRSVVLAVDVSGSMRGGRVRTLAAAVGALAAELQRDDLGVLAFWSDAAVLQRVGAPVQPERLLDWLLRIPARGLTNVAFPLQLALRELQRAPARDARVVLLSDCVHNAGPDPRDVARRLPRLDVLLDAAGEKDVALGRDLAKVGGGVLRTVSTYGQVPRAIAEVFES